MLENGNTDNIGKKKPLVGRLSGGHREGSCLAAGLPHNLRQPTYRLTSDCILARVRPERPLRQGVMLAMMISDDQVLS